MDDSEKDGAVIREKTVQRYLRFKAFSKNFTTFRKDSRVLPRNAP